MRLARRFNIEIASSRVTHVVHDIFMFSEHDRVYLKGNYGLYKLEGNRYIAEAVLKYGWKEDHIDTTGYTTDDVTRRTMVRTGTAAIDNVPSGVSTYCPNMACKRAVIKGIVDLLGLRTMDIVEDFYESKEMAENDKATKKNAGKKGPKKKIDKIDETQLNTIKVMHNELKKKFAKKKYSKMNKEQASKEIEKLNMLIKKKK